MKKKSSGIKKIFFFILIMFNSTGCMMGIKMGGPVMSSLVSIPSIKERVANTEQAVNRMIEEAVSDLSSQDLDINSIAVWPIKSQTAGLNVETIRQKLIVQLVTLDRFKVISRQRLDELLDEQNLSSSGAIDEESAVEFGNLIAVDGFVDGYASIEKNRFILSFTLIETKSGLIVWAKTVEKTIQP